MRFEPDDTASALGIRREVIERRDCGQVYIEFRRVFDAAANAEVVASAFVTTLGLRAPSAWKQLDSRAARDAASRVLREDLAYSGSIMTVEVANALAIRFIEHCGDGAQFLTNGEIGLSASGGWQPITTATFDTGVIGIAGDRLGFLWVEDED